MTPEGWPEGQYGSILIDPPWPFRNRTGKISPEHRRLHRYATMKMEDIYCLPVVQLALPQSHLYLWCPMALIDEGKRAMASYGFTYKTAIVWYKVRKDGGPDGRGCGFYFRTVTELLLFGVKGNLRTGKGGRTETNIIVSPKREHSRKPDEVYSKIQRCSPGPYIEIFARYPRENWTQFGDQLEGT